MCRPAGCPLWPLDGRPLPRVVVLVGLLPHDRGAVAFFFGAGAEVPGDVVVSALKPNLAQTLLVEEGLFLDAGALRFSILDRVPGS